MARPTIFASASGELYTRSLPNWRCSPHVTLKTPPLPFTCARYCSRLASATSSPNTRMRGSRAISSLRQVLRRSTIVVGSPPNWGSSSVSNCSEVGSTRSEEHTSELQSLRHLVCRLLLEKKKQKNKTINPASQRDTFRQPTWMLSVSTGLGPGHLRHLAPHRSPHRFVLPSRHAHFQPSVH